MARATNGIGAIGTQWALWRKQHPEWPWRWATVRFGVGEASAWKTTLAWALENKGSGPAIALGEGALRKGTTLQRVLLLGLCREWREFVDSRKLVKMCKRMVDRWEVLWGPYSSTLDIRQEGLNYKGKARGKSIQERNAVCECLFSQVNFNGPSFEGSATSPGFILGGLGLLFKLASPSIKPWFPHL